MHKNILRATLLGLAAALWGCATVNPSVPVGYTGPTATITDSVKSHDSHSADFFYVESVDGKPIDQSRDATHKANFGKGMSMTPYVLDRLVPARTLQLELVGRTDHAAPILAMTGTEYQVKGSITFTPEANKVYVVKGELGEKYSAVWLEEQSSGTLVDKKIEVNGSAALGLFEK